MYKSKSHIVKIKSGARYKKEDSQT